MARKWVFENRNGDHKHNDQNGWGCDGLWYVDGGLVLGTGQGWESGYNGPKDDAKALIEAAPQLLEACEKALRFMRGERNPECIVGVDAMLGTLKAAIEAAQPKGEDANG